MLEKQNNSNTPDIIKYKKFTIRIIQPKKQYACYDKNSWNLSISYTGESEITKKSLKSYSNFHNVITKALVENSVKPLHRLTKEEKESDTTKVIVSNDLRRQKGWLKPFHKFPNKYSNFL